MKSSCRVSRVNIKLWRWMMMVMVMIFIFQEPKQASLSWRNILRNFILRFVHFCPSYFCFIRLHKFSYFLFFFRLCEFRPRLCWNWTCFCFVCHFLEAEEIILLNARGLADANDACSTKKSWEGIKLLRFWYFSVLIFSFNFFFNLCAMHMKRLQNNEPKRQALIGVNTATEVQLEGATLKWVKHVLFVWVPYGIYVFFCYLIYRAFCVLVAGCDYFFGCELKWVDMGTAG